MATPQYQSLCDNRKLIEDSLNSNPGNLRSLVDKLQQRMEWPISPHATAKDLVDYLLQRTKVGKAEYEAFIEVLGEFGSSEFDEVTGVLLDSTGKGD